MTRTLLTGDPQVVTMPARSIIGPKVHYTPATRDQIPQQWASYNASPECPDPGPGGSFGVCIEAGEDGFDYLCGVEAGKAPLAAGWSEVSIPSGRWARFVTTAHISDMMGLWGEIYRDWIGRPGYEKRRGAQIEFYPQAFDGRTGLGGYEVWIPVV